MKNLKELTLEELRSIDGGCEVCKAVGEFIGALIKTLL